MADAVGRWDQVRIFAHAVDKSSFEKKHPGQDIFENSFTQIVSRFEKFLSNMQRPGILVQDNNPTVSKKLTQMMRKFHKQGTAWIDIKNIVETPFFVDSQLTSMIQVADTCAYATRRYYENNENTLFSKIFPKFDRVKGQLVGIRHYPAPDDCACLVCKEVKLNKQTQQ